MKKLIFLSLILVAMLASCDHVDFPYPKKDPNIGNTENCTDFTFLPATPSKYRKILIEDYTGHTCLFCPYAAIQLHQIDSMYPGQIVGLGIHAGSTFANPDGGFHSSPDTAFLAAYRTPTGDVYDAFFKASATGLPQGMINRRDYNETTLSHLKDYHNWKVYIAPIVNDTEPKVNVQIGINYDPANRKICCAVKDSFLTTMTDSMSLIVLLVQDSIVDWQYYGGTVIPNYVHRHILRAKLTDDAWGIPLGTGALSAGAAHINKFAYTVPDKYPIVGAEENKTPFYINASHIVAFIYNRRTYEVMQVEEVKVPN